MIENVLEVLDYLQNHCPMVNGKPPVRVSIEVQKNHIVDGLIFRAEWWVEDCDGDLFSVQKIYTRGQIKHTKDPWVISNDFTAYCGGLIQGEDLSMTSRQGDRQ